MYAEIESMKDMLEINLENRLHTPILLLSRFTDIDNSTTSEASYMLRVWKEEVQHFLTSKDAGCIINSGNVLVLIEAERTEEFLRKVHKLRIISKNSSLETDALILSDEISHLFLNYA